MDSPAVDGVNLRRRARPCPTRPYRRPARPAATLWGYHTRRHNVTRAGASRLPGLRGWNRQNQDLRAPYRVRGDVIMGFSRRRRTLRQDWCRCGVSGPIPVIEALPVGTRWSMEDSTGRNARATNRKVGTREAPGQMTGRFCGSGPTLLAATLRLSPTRTICCPGAASIKASCATRLICGFSIFATATPFSTPLRRSSACGCRAIPIRLRLS